jgi:hypothetical protein
VTDTPNLGLPYIEAAQAQKHATHNEALRALDALVQISVLDRDLSAPPASPADGARYIVASGASGTWAGHVDHVAAYQDGAWAFHAPHEGWLAWIADEDILTVWSGTAWIAASSAPSLQNVPMIGINATADTTNRLSVSSPATLLSHEGAGHQLKINKAAAANTASLLYQDAFSGRAELGLAGDDDFRIKVSTDGSIWRDAIRVDRTTGEVFLPNTTAFLPIGPSLLVNGDFAINQRAFAGGALASGVYGHDRWKADLAGTSYTSASSTQIVTLTSGRLSQSVEPALWGFVNLASRQITVSVENPAGGDITVTVGSATGTITPGSGRRGATLTTAAGDTGPLPVKLAGTAVSFARAKAEIGTVATSWVARPSAQELQLAKRYFQVNSIADVILAVAWNTGQLFSQYVAFAVPMRAVPALTFANAYDGTANLAFLSGSWQTPTSTSTNGLSVNGGNMVLTKTASFTAQQTYLVQGRITCDAEL